jgi:hypothetical protein
MPEEIKDGQDTGEVKEVNTVEAEAAERAEIWKEVAQEEAAAGKEETGGEQAISATNTGLPAMKDNEPAPGVNTDSDVSKTHGNVASLEKALNDTKTWARRLEDKNAELMRQMEELKKGNGSVEAVQTAQEAVNNVQGKMDEIAARAVEDYPELKDVLDLFSNSMKALQTEVTQLKTVRQGEAEKSKKDEALADFNANIKPKVLETHKDFDAIVTSNEYWTWAEKQRPSLRVAAMDSADPEDITWAITEFKRSKASAQAGAIADKDADKRDRKISQAGSMLRGGSSSFPVRQKDSKGELSWKEAGALLEEQGVKA